MLHLLVSDAAATLNSSLKDLNDILLVKIGGMANFENGESSIPVDKAGHTSAIPSWKSIVTKNVQNVLPENIISEDTVYNNDGTATIHPSKSFLLNARKQWSSSCIGHFIGGGFDFKTVKAQAFKHWKNQGLSKVYYSSKGYYTFRFNSVDAMNSVLSAGTIQMGGENFIS